MKIRGTLDEGPSFRLNFNSTVVFGKFSLIYIVTMECAIHIKQTVSQVKPSA